MIGSALRRGSLFTTTLSAALILSACGGGSDGATGAPGAPGATGPQGPAGANGVDASAVVKVNELTADQFAAISFNAAVTKVTIPTTAPSNPVVEFTVTDANNHPVVGLGSTAKSGTATLASYPNFAFAMAKLMPGFTATGTVVVPPATTPTTSTTFGPSRWVSYIVTTVPTTTAAATARAPSTDTNGTLVDLGNGSYKYTFFTDVTQVKAQVAGFTNLGTKVASDLDDLTYEPSRIHRVSLVISGNVPGTGTNTSNAVQVVPGVPFSKPVNVMYDFIPGATGVGTPVATSDAGQRLIVDKASCNECHTKLGGIPGTESSAFHGGSRQDPKYCVMCHTDQRKFGAKVVTSTAGAFDPATSATVFDGVNVANLPVLIHRVHKGSLLVKKGYNFGGVLLNETKFPQDIRNCTKCHDNTAPKLAPQADNYKTVPSVLACGACHDGINFTTGTGTTNAGLATGHVGGPQANDTLCAICHTPANIQSVYHLPVAPPAANNSLLVAGGNANTNAAWVAANWNNLPAGAIKVSYDVSSVSRNASKQPVIKFKMKQDAGSGFVDVPFQTFAAGTTTELWANFMGSPSVYFVFAVPQDGILKPAEFNASVSGYLKGIWNGSATGTGAGTMTGPDATGYYTVTLTGVTIPDSATMLTGGLGYTYSLTSTMPLTQTNLADYPVTTAITNAALKTGGLIVVAPDAQKVATSYTGRRAIVEDKRCNSCHLELGIFTEETFHGGQRNDGTTCSWCHTPNRASSGWSADSTTFIHSIHAASKRDIAFTWHAATTTESFGDIGYPAVLNACETCHLPGTYDFSATASAVPNRLYRTVATGLFNKTAGTTNTTYSVVGGVCVAGTSSAQTALGVFSLSPYIGDLTNYGNGFSFNAGLNPTNPSCDAGGNLIAAVPAGGTLPASSLSLVTSPITSACFSCHDSSLAQSHMTTNGGSIYTPRAAALANPEQCVLCHGDGKLASIKIVHAK
jgi:OmcA/MtrC family decaheme c-type cytochrome